MRRESDRLGQQPLRELLGDNVVALLSSQTQVIDRISDLRRGFRPFIVDFNSHDVPSVVADAARCVSAGGRAVASQACCRNFAECLLADLPYSSVTMWAFDQPNSWATISGLKSVAA
jgi:hypothetical protein